MRNSKGKLIRFMQLKNELITTKTGEDLEYFSDIDAIAIANWKVKDANSIWKMILKNILPWNGFALRSKLCPFCLKRGLAFSAGIDKYSMDCDKCEYAKNHGTCNWDSPNTYNIVRAKLESVNQGSCPTNKEYWEILHQIEKEEATKEKEAIC